MTLNKFAPLWSIWSYHIALLEQLYKDYLHTTLWKTGELDFNNAL